MQDCKECPVSLTSKTQCLKYKPIHKADMVPSDTQFRLFHCLCWTTIIIGLQIASTPYGRTKLQSDLRIAGPEF